MHEDYIRLLLGIFGTLLFGVAVLAASRLLSGPVRAGRESIMDVVLNAIGWTLIWCSILSLSFAIFAGLPLVAVFSAIVIQIRGTRARKHALLFTMGVAAKRMMPLAPVIEAFADEQPGRIAQRARLLASRLKSGWLLPDALDASRGLIPSEARATIRTGFEAGTLAAALENAADNDDLRDTVWAEMGSKLFYLCCLVLFGSLLAIFMMLRIAPAFQMIFMDFDVALPGITIFAIAAFNILTQFFYLLFFPLCILALYGYLRYTGLIRWDLPGVTRLARRLHTATVLDALATLARHDRPLVDGIAGLARTYPKRLIRRRLNRVASDVEAGVNWCDSMARRGLIGRADRAVLQAAARVGNLPWAMAEMADSNRRRLAQRCYVWLQIAFTLVILTMGASVLLFCVSYFLPLVGLIQSLT